MSHSNRIVKSLFWVSEVGGSGGRVRRSRRLKQIQSRRQRSFLAFELLENRALMAADGCTHDSMIQASFGPSEQGELVEQKGLFTGPTLGASLNSVLKNLSQREEDLAEASGNSTPVAISTIILNDATPVQFPLPLTAKNPPGSLVYDATIAGTIATSSDVNNFTIDVDPGQKISVYLDPAATLKGLIRLFDSSNNLLGSATNTTGLDAVIQTISTLPVIETYRIEVSSDGGATTGAYALGVILNAREEAESHNGLANDTFAAAEDINGSFIALNGTVSRGAVLGLATGSDFYQFNVISGETITLAVQSFTGGAINVALFDPAGVQVASAVSGPTNVSRLLSSFVVAVGGSYRARVTAATAGTNYNLVVLKNGDFDRESNDSLAPPQTLIGGQGVLGAITFLGIDDDWYSFSVNAGDLVNIQTRTPADGTGEFLNNLNPKLELYDPSGLLVASGTVLVDGRNEQTLHTATAAGNYRLRMSGESSTTGEYFVSVTGYTGTAKPPFQVTSTNPPNGASFLSQVSVYTVDFNDTVLVSSLQASDLKVNGINATSVSPVDGDTALFILPSGLGSGTHTITIAASAILDVQNTPVAAFSATFTVDPIAPRVVATSVAANAVLAPGALSYLVTFSEPMKVSNLSTDDFILHGNLRQTAGVNYTPSSFSFNPAGTVLTLDFTSLPDDDYSLALVAGTTGGTNFADAAGNALDGEFSGTFPSGNGVAGGNFVIGFDIDTATETYAALNARNPLGSLVYGGSLVRTIAFTGDTDEFMLNVDPNQTLSVVVTPTTVTTSVPTLQPRIELFDSMNVLLGSAIAPAPGSVTGLQAQSFNSGGTYRIAVNGLAGTEGEYTIEVTLNAAFEREDRIEGNATNNTTGTAENIDGSFINLDTTQSNARRGAVIGTSDFSSAPLPTEIEPNNTQATSNIAVANFAPTSGNLYQLGFKGGSSTTTDVDFYNIGTLEVGDALTVSVSGSPSARGTNTDTFVRLYRGTPASPILVASNDDNGPGLDSLLSAVTIFTTDTYYVQVDARVKARAGSYDVALYLENFDTAPLTGGAFANESEPNNTAATANNASTSWRAVQYLSRTESNISASTDRDFYRYQFTAGDLITVNIDSQSALDARVNLRNAAGTIIASEDGTSVGPGTDSPIYSFIVPSTGPYFVEVLPATGTGAYNLDVLLSSSASPPVPGIGEDYYSFTASAGQSLSLVLTNSADGNVDLQLIGVDGTTVLAGGAGNGTNLNEAISNVQVSTAGTYFVRVTGTGGIPYNLEVLKNASFDKEPNNSFETAQALAGSRGVLGAITAALGSSIDAIDSGWIASNGLHDTTNNNYITGQSSDEIRNYSTFSIPSATPTIIGAELRLFNPGLPNAGYISADPSETYTLFDVSASSAALDTTRTAGDPTGIAIHADLGSGTVFGTRVVTSADNGTAVAITLNAAGLAALNAAIGSTISFGGAVTTLSGTLNQLIFGYTNGAIGTVQLVLQTEPEADWYSLAVNAGDSLSIQSSTPADGTRNFINILNPKLELYNPSGALVGSGTVLADARNEIILHTATQSGNYRVWVSSEDTTVGEYFVSVTGNTGTALPPFLVTTTNPSNGSLLFTAPTVYTVNFNDSILPSTLQATDLKVNGIPATAVTLVDGDTAAFTLPSGLGDGSFAITIAEGAILGIQNSPLQAFSATFSVDTVAPKVTATSIASNAVLAPGALSYTMTFSEPMRTSNILLSGDFTLRGNLRQNFGEIYTPNSFSFNPAGTELTLNFANLPDDDYTLTLDAGGNGGTNFTDLAGFALDGEFSGTFPSGNGVAGGDFVIGFDVDVATEAFASLNTKNPQGSLVYDGSLIRTIASASDVDEFTLNVDPNQTISIIVTPTSPTTSPPTLQPRIELIDPSNVSLSVASAASAGGLTMIQSQSTTSGGTYRITVSGLGTLGRYTIDVILNSAIELEGKFVGTTNNDAATAQDINASFINLNTTLTQAKRGAALGITESLGYAVSAVAPTLTDISTTGTRSISAVGDDAVDTLQVSQLNGFTFPFFGTTYNTLSFSTNGLITFGGATGAFSNTDLNGNPVEATIAVLWDDLNIDNTGTGAASQAIFWQVTGSGAGQQLIIQWNNIRRLGGNTYFTLQAVLSGDGSIQFNYSPTLATTEVTSATVGIKAPGSNNPGRQLLHFDQSAGPLVGPNLSTRITPVSLVDFYKFDATAGESASVVIKELTAGNLDVRLIGTDGTTVLASGIAGASNLNEAISNFVFSVAGTYFVSVSGDGNVPYSLVVNKNAGFDTENNSSFTAAQSLDGSRGVLGHVAASTSNAMLVDFESGNHGFTVENGDTGLWHLTTQRGSQTGHSSVTSFHYGREGGTYDSGQSNTGSIVSPVITLPSSGPIPFGFNYVLQTEASAFLDRADVQVSTDNFATFTTIASRSTNLFNSNDWREFTSSLTAFAGQNIRIRWAFDTLNSSDNNHAGWFVDDVRIGVFADDDWYSVTVPNAGEQLRFETSTPADGAGEFANSLNPHIELYRPDGVLLTSGIALADGRNELIQINAPVAGTYRVRVTAEGTLDGEYFLGSSVGNTPPTVTSIIVAGSTWTATFVDAVDGGGPGTGNGLGYALTSGSSLPNSGIDRIYIQFSEPVTGFDASHVALLGVHVADYSGGMTVSYDVQRMRGMIQLSNSIANDNLRIGVSDAITDLAMTAFDGDSDTFAGGIFDFRFNVAIGDANNDGNINGGDLPSFAASFNTNFGHPGYNPRADWNSDGAVNGGDLPLFALHFNRTPSLAEPSALDFQANDPDSTETESLFAPFVDDIDAFYSQLDEEDELLLLDEQGLI